MFHTHLSFEIQIISKESLFFPKSQEGLRGPSSLLFNGHQALFPQEEEQPGSSTQREGMGGAIRIQPSYAFMAHSHSLFYF
jgi:hypothetical protein